MDLELFSILYVAYMFLDVGNALRMALLLSQLFCSQPSNYESRSVNLAIMNARNLFYSTTAIIAVSFNKCTLCKSLWIIASAKCPKWKWKCNVLSVTGNTELGILQHLIRAILLFTSKGLT